MATLAPCPKHCICSQNTGGNHLRSLEEGQDIIFSLKSSKRQLILVSSFYSAIFSHAVCIDLILGCTPWRNWFECIEIDRFILGASDINQPGENYWISWEVFENWKKCQRNVILSKLSQPEKVCAGTKSVTGSRNTKMCQKSFVCLHGYSVESQSLQKNQLFFQIFAITTILISESSSLAINAWEAIFETDHYPCALFLAPPLTLALAWW